MTGFVSWTHSHGIAVCVINPVAGTYLAIPRDLWHALESEKETRHYVMQNYYDGSMTA
jgi:hypothetical protein